ncbi:MAG: fused MFS/spermidine synthase [Anaerolineales bacterium]|jgi:MFS family permease
MRTYLYFTVFASGMTTLAIEMSASRLLGPAFGVSNLVWASIIGLILIYLTLGYFIGGRWADRSPYPKTMYTVLLWGAFTAGLIPLAARPVLRLAANAFDLLQVGVLVGSFSSVLLLFIVPITLLGTISPFAIRLAITDPLKVGTIAGRIYAISTLGSFIGTFLPALVLTPLIGTTYTFMAFSGFLTLVALGGLWKTAGWRATLPWAWMPLVLVLLALFGVRGPLKTTDGQIYEGESGYNYIQVVERDGHHLLRLNEGQGIHSQWHPTILDYQGPWEQFLAAPFFNPPSDGIAYQPEMVESIAIIGLAAGTIARQASEVYGPIPIDGYEIDPKIIQVGRDYFDMNQPNLNAIAEDGRLGLERSTRRYTIIAVDAYRPPYIPWHLATREFFQLTYDRLNSDGVLAINVGRAPEDRRLIDALVGTIQTVFPSVYVMDVPGSFNSMVYASVQPSQVTDLYNNFNQLLKRGDGHPLLLESLYRVVYYMQPTPVSDIVYTDDWAPIEWLTNDMVLNFVLFGDMEELQ